MSNAYRIILVLAICIFGSLIVMNMNCGGGTYTGSTGNPTSTSTSTSTGTSTDVSGGHGGQTGTSTQSLGGVGGCVVVTPSGYSEGTAVPLLLTWCGNPGDFPTQMTDFYSSVASSKHFIICSIPHANVTSDSVVRAEGAKAAGIRDELFTKYNILKKKVYCSGFSGGGNIAFYVPINVVGFYGIICLSSCVGSNDWANSNGPVKIWWRTATNDPYFPDSACSSWAATAAGAPNNHIVDYAPIPGNTHSLSIHNAADGWNYVCP